MQTTVELHTLRILEGDKCPTLRHVDTIGWGTHVHSKDAAEASWPECSYNVNTIFNVIAIQCFGIQINRENMHVAELKEG